MHGLNLENLRWILSDGRVLGVWEPVSLLFKSLWMQLYLTLSAAAAPRGGVPAAPSSSAHLALVLSLALHALNTLGAFLVCDGLPRYIAAFTIRDVRATCTCTVAAPALLSASSPPARPAQQTHIGLCNAPLS